MHNLAKLPSSSRVNPLTLSTPSFRLHSDSGISIIKASVHTTRSNTTTRQLRYFKHRSNNLSLAASSSSPSKVLKDKDWHKLSRVYYDGRMALHQDVLLKDTLVHYLSNVMRLKEGYRFRIFNSLYGEYVARIISRPKRDELLIAIDESIRLPELSILEDLPVVLFFAPIKKANMKTMLTKVTELGIQHLVPVITQNTNHDVNDLRSSYLPYLIESVEQSERLTIPEIYPSTSIDDLISRLSADEASSPTRALTGKAVFAADKKSISFPIPSIVLFGRERKELAEVDPRVPISKAMNEITWSCHPKGAPAMIGFFCGPEGGFTAQEMSKLETLSCIKPISLGANILRAETASIAAVACISSAWDAHKHATASFRDNKS
jgi:16S rRNA (uracil1498-N3)-methyltransferase